jgi:tRNA(Leu) C34 or U34 (ribose-2'-O)-methylase TrmL
MAKKKPGGKVPGVILINPKFGHNVGAALRACSCFGIPQLIYTGDRIEGDLAMRKRLPREERMKGYKDVEFAACDYPFERLPDNAVTVAVELRENSESLTYFEHPPDAVYVFGPEDGSLRGVTLRQCHRFIVIPSHHCLNLAAAVNVVLYDRRMKRQLAGLEPPMPMLREHRGML